MTAPIDPKAKPQTDPQALIAALGLMPHPEGGWYRETWRAEAAEGERPTATAIHFLLEASQRSHWHRVDAAEIWFWHAGSPCVVEIAPDDAASGRAGPVTRHVLGGSVLAGEAPQVLVPTGHWQATTPEGGWVLVSCVVSPGFDFAGFELAAPEWSPG